MHTAVKHVSRLAALGVFTLITVIGCGSNEADFASSQAKFEADMENLFAMDLERFEQQNDENLQGGDITGCSHGYWKNHTDSWEPTGLVPGQTILSVYEEADRYPSVADKTLLEGLNFGGGKCDIGAIRNLLKQSIGLLLNGLHPDINTPWPAENTIAYTNAAMKYLDRGGDCDLVRRLAEAMDRENNPGDCPLN